MVRLHDARDMQVGVLHTRLQPRTDTQPRYYRNRSRVTWITSSRKLEAVKDNISQLGKFAFCTLALDNHLLVLQQVTSLLVYKHIKHSPAAS